MEICPSKLLLDQLLEGTLPAAESQTVRNHLRACADCQEAIDSRIESPWLRDWSPAARRGALDQPDDPLLVALLRKLGENLPHSTLAENSTASGPIGLPFLAPSPVAGELGLLGPYRVQAEIGRGGMGIVLRGWDENLKRCVALKIVRPDLDDSKSRQRLVREAQAGASFRHDHAVTVHAVVDPPEGLPYLVMEHLSGPTLAALLQARRMIPAREAVALLVGIADALGEAHKSGLIHRDVKPTNILLDETTGRAKLTDFGLARTGDVSRLTRESAVAGTPAYMSPEQAQGRSQLDCRTDVYSLGMTLFELLTGEVPFHGALHLVLRQVIQEEPRPPRQLNDEIPRDLETICLKSIAKDPGRRYQSAALFAADLRRWQRGEPILARPAGRVEKLERWCRRNPRVAVLTSSLGLVLLAFGVGASLVALRLDKDRATIATERNVAILAREKADASAGAARDHFEIALASLSSLLQEVNRLETSPGFLPLKKHLTETALQGLERISLSAERNPSGDSRVLSAHEQLSELYILLGKTTEARAQLEMLLRRGNEQLAESPDSVIVLRGLAKAHDRLGDLVRYDLNNNAAAQHYRAAHEVRIRLQNANPADLMARRDVAVSLGKMADTKADRGAFREAEAGFLQELAVLEGLKEAGSDPILSLRDFRFVESRLGQVCTRLFEFASARKHYLQALTHAQALEAVGVADAAFQISLALEGLGIAALRADDCAEAVRNFEKCLPIRRRIAEAAPGNVEAQRNVCTTLYNLGDCHFHARDLDRARARYREALAIYEPLALADAGSLKRQMDVSMTLVQLIMLETSAEHFAEVLTLDSHMKALWQRLEKNSAAAQLAPARVLKLVQSDMELVRKAAQLDLSNPDAAKGTEGELRCGLLFLQSAHLARRGQHEEASRLAEQAHLLDPESKRLNFAGRCHALCAEAIDRAHSNALLTPALQAARDRYVERAFHYLAEHIKLQSPIRSIVAAHPDWNSIRKHPSFNKIVWGIGQ